MNASQFLFELTFEESCRTHNHGQMILAEEQAASSMVEYNHWMLAGGDQPGLGLDQIAGGSFESLVIEDM